jgi:hypothetical protein
LTIFLETIKITLLNVKLELGLLLEPVTELATLLILLGDCWIG